MADRRRGRSGWLLGIVVVLALAWVGYWYTAHYFAEQAIARMTSGPVNGRAIACGGIALSGFPLRLDFNCTGGTYAETGDQATAALGGVAASAPLYWPGSVEAKLTAPLTLNVPDRGLALTANWTSGAASAGAGIGGLKSAGASFTGVTVENTGPVPGIGLTGLAAESASGSLSPAGSGSYDIAADAKQLAVTRADGTPIPVLDADVRATALNVGDLGTNPSRALVAWLRGTPSVDIKNLRVAAAGAIVAASGNLSLSPKGLLNGSILLRYNSIEGLASLMGALKPGSGEKYQAALQGLQAMSKPVDSEDGKALQTTLTFTDGLIWLTIIPLPIDPIPPIRF